MSHSCVWFSWCSVRPPRSSQLYQTFDTILVLAHGQTLYSGPGSFAPVHYFNQQVGAIPKYQEGYNVADYLLEVASDPPVSLFQMSNAPTQSVVATGNDNQNAGEGNSRTGLTEKDAVGPGGPDGATLENGNVRRQSGSSPRGRYAASFLTQLEVLSGREWKILRR
jgi:hypothetical protein